MNILKVIKSIFNPTIKSDIYVVPKVVTSQQFRDVVLKLHPDKETAILMASVACSTKMGKSMKQSTVKRYMNEPNRLVSIKTYNKVKNWGVM